MNKREINRIEKLKKLIKAFSLVELLISLITVAAISAAFAPVITKKIKSSNIMTRQGAKGEAVKFDCSEYKAQGEENSSCFACDNKECLLCVKLCASGEYLNTFDCQCHPCSSPNTNCVYCEFNKNKENPGPICEQCLEGYYISDGACIECELGYKCLDGISKIACDPDEGEYQDETGQSSCKSCRDTNNCYKCYSATSGDCYSCKGGYGRESYSSNNCVKCDAGHYSEDDYRLPAFACHECFNGYYCSSDQTCAGSCNDVTPVDHCYRYYTTQDACQECSGSYELVGVECVFPGYCNKGYYLSDNGTECVKVGWGRYQPYDHYTGSYDETLPCPAGTYAPWVEGSYYCEDCPFGFSSNEGAGSRSQCFSCNIITCEHFIKGTCTCDTCATDYTLVDGNCCKMAGCTHFSSACVCDACGENFELVDGSCVSTCNPATYNCVSYSEECNCSECNPGYMPIDGICTSCSVAAPGCAEYTSWYSSSYPCRCDTPSYGWYVSYDTYLPITCGEAAQKQIGYFLVSGSGECKQKIIWGFAPYPCSYGGNYTCGYESFYGNSGCTGTKPYRCGYTYMSGQDEWGN